MEFVKKCDKFHSHANLHHAPIELLHYFTPPWSFHQWGVDILGNFPITPGQLKFLIMVMIYFARLIEAEFVSKITDKVYNIFIGRRLCAGSVYQELSSQKMEPNSPVPLWSTSATT